MKTKMSTCSKIIIGTLLVLICFTLVIISTCIYFTDHEHYIYLFSNNIDVYIISRVMVCVVFALLIIVNLVSNLRWPIKIVNSALILFVFLIVYLFILIRTHGELPIYRRIYSPNNSYELVTMETETLLFRYFRIYMQISPYKYECIGSLCGHLGDSFEENITIEWSKNQVHMEIDTTYDPNSKEITIKYEDLNSAYAPKVYHKRQNIQNLINLGFTQNGRTFY